MDRESVKAQVLALPEVAAWPELADKFDRVVTQSAIDWTLPLLACQAVGGDVSMAVPGAAATACWAIGFMLVDDMLDEDPRGEYLRSGSGPTANLALAFHGLAFRVIEQAAVGADRRAAIIASLASATLTITQGQHQDTQNPSCEEDYWKVARAKTAPFYGTSFYIGALLGDAGAEVAAELRELGMLLGEMAQVRDDLNDAFQTPAGPDWAQGRANLPILYARTIRHPDRVRFVDLLSRVSDPQALQEAQQILIACGAVSYCVYHLVKRYQACEQLLGKLSLADSAPLAGLLERQNQPLIRLLRACGAETPPELIRPLA